MTSHALAAACPATRQHQTTRAHLQAAGLTRTQLESLVKSAGLVRLRRGVYAPAPLPVSGRHLLSGGVPDAAYVAQVRAVLLSLGAGCAAACRTAAVLWGMDLFVEPRRIEVAVRRSRSRVAMAAVHVMRCTTMSVLDLDVLGLESLCLTTPLRTVLDCARTRPLREAVVIADSALRVGLFTVDELVTAVAAEAGKPGCRKLRRLLELVDPDSGSVLESLFRVLVVEAGLVPVSQFIVRTRSGAAVGRFDFCFELQRLIVECDGRRWHDPEDVRDKDRRPGNELERLRWRLLRVTWAEVVHQPEYVLQLVKDCLEPATVAA